MGVALHVYVHAYFRIPENLLQALQDVFPYLAQGTPGCGHVRWGPTDLSGRIPLNLLSPFACTFFFFVFRSPHRVSSDTDLAQRRIRTSCVYVTHLILWSDFSVRLSTIPLTVTIHHSLSVALWMLVPLLFRGGVRVLRCRGEVDADGRLSRRL